MNLSKQLDLFAEDPVLEKQDSEWTGMPEYQNVKDSPPEVVATFKFKTREAFERFEKVIKKELYEGQRVFDGMQKKDQKTTWFPLKEKASKFLYQADEPISPRFPVYVVSKGRWERNPTSRSLMEMGVPFHLIVEQDEFEQYAKAFPNESILILPERYKEEYDCFWKDEDPRTGPGPARNFAWDHSMDLGFTHHWVMDDNIESFERLNHNKKVKCTSGNGLYACEDFVLRYENVAISGPNYSIFCPSADSRPPYKMNTRIYSCLLIRNDIPFRWRGRYNEDTDLSINVMKAGWCTVQFNFLLQGKRATQTMKGGNNDEFYENEGTLKKSKILEEMHPDVAKVVWRFNRWHHHVDYRPFEKNRLVRKKDIIVPQGVNNYGMELRIKT